MSEDLDRTQPLPRRTRQIKYKERWYIDSYPTSAGEFKLKQARSDVTIAVFSLMEEAQWVCNKLNHGRALCESIRTALNVDDWLQREPKSVTEDLMIALREYTRDND